MPGTSLDPQPWALACDNTTLISETNLVFPLFSKGSSTQTRSKEGRSQARPEEGRPQARPQEGRPQARQEGRPQARQEVITLLE